MVGTTPRIEDTPESDRPDIGQIFDEVFAELMERESSGEKLDVPQHEDPEVAAAGAALNAIFGGDHHLTADLSVDQVYAKALPHFVTILKHMLREQDDA